MAFLREDLVKLAEALVLRADLVKRLDELRARMKRSAKVQEGQKPAEDPAALLTQYHFSAAELERLIAGINMANASARVVGRSMTEALAARDVLRLRHGAQRELAENAAVTQNAYTKSEIRWLPAVNVAEVQAGADKLAQELRQLDTRIQEANRLIDLSE